MGLITAGEEEEEKRGFFKRESETGMKKGLKEEGMRVYYGVKQAG